MLIKCLLQFPLFSITPALDLALQLQPRVVHASLVLSYYNNSPVLCCPPTRGLHGALLDFINVQHKETRIPLTSCMAVDPGKYGRSAGSALQHSVISVPATAAEECA
ncbi:hypothetical protein ILYODFUR_030502 [Ilyodon furcidens]|uniref:Secreted protein n=1 Tax=Ilyodon furcidens TaxID=33524 RepID=A0ABV0U0Q9_9TELE